MDTSDRLTAFSDALRRAAALRDALKECGVIITKEGMMTLLDEMAAKGDGRGNGIITAPQAKSGNADSALAAKLGEARTMFERIEAVLAHTKVAMLPREIADLMVSAAPPGSLPATDPAALRPRVSTELARVEDRSDKSGQPCPVRRVGESGKWTLTGQTASQRVRLEEGA